VHGALLLAESRRLLSWSWDGTLRLWDVQSGACLHELKGHSDWVRGALALADDRILSWSEDRTLRLWDGQSGNFLETVAESEAAKLHPEWLYAREKSRNPENTCSDCFARSFGRTAYLGQQNIQGILTAWQADSEATSRVLLLDGTAAVAQEDGQVCFLKLYHSNRRISLAEVEEIIAKQMKKEE
jgi:WD40 repeat protein